MKHFNLPVFFLTLFASISASAAPKEFPQNILVLVDEATNKKVTIYSPVNGAASEVVGSTFAEDDSQPVIFRFNVGSDKVKWTLKGSPWETEHPFQYLELDLGRSGYLKIAKNKDEGCTVVSTMLAFPVRKPTSMSCNYFFSTGPRPALSGSN